MAEKKKLIVAVTGASGSLYAKVLLNRLHKLSDQVDKAALIFSDNARQVWEHETGDASYRELPFAVYDKSDFNAPFASGSARYTIMVVCPCSMGTLARIAQGISNDLITRAADVILKERRRLILVTRDTPLSLIHINNMKRVTEAGGIILPASPSFYSKPATLEDAVGTVVDRILDIAGFENVTYRWNDD